MNAERVLDRGEKIELLVTRTEQLQDQSYRFSSESRRLKWSMCRDNYRLWAILVIVVIVRLPCPTIPNEASSSSKWFNADVFFLSLRHVSLILPADHRVAHLIVHLRLRLLQVLVKGAHPSQLSQDLSFFFPQQHNTLQVSFGYNNISHHIDQFPCNGVGAWKGRA
jgi:hypothetical protein